MISDFIKMKKNPDLSRPGMFHFTFRTFQESVQTMKQAPSCNSHQNQHSSYLGIIVAAGHFMEVQQWLVDTLFQCQRHLHGIQASSPLITVWLLHRQRSDREAKSLNKSWTSKAVSVHLRKGINCSKSTASLFTAALPCNLGKALHPPPPTPCASQHQTELISSWELQVLWAWYSWHSWHILRQCPLFFPLGKILLQILPAHKTQLIALYLLNTKYPITLVSSSF